MKQRYMVIDTALCHDCNNCFMACKDEHCDNDWMPYVAEQPRHGHRWMNIMRHERGQYPRIDTVFLPMPCMHCQDAPCMQKCGDVISRREDGVVMIDASKAKGKKEAVDACPYGAIYWNEKENVPQKCTMCAHLLDEGWAETRCVHTCPTGAMKFFTIEPEEMKKMVAAEGLEQYKAELKTNPNVYYKNLHRYTKHFIAGAILIDGDCVEGAKVSIKDAAGNTCSQETNFFGDFKFDALVPGSYTLDAEAKGKKASCTVDIVDKSLNIGYVEI